MESWLTWANISLIKVSNVVLFQFKYLQVYILGMLNNLLSMSDQVIEYG